MVREMLDVGFGVRLPMREESGSLLSERGWGAQAVFAVEQVCGNKSGREQHERTGVTTTAAQVRDPSHLVAVRPIPNRVDQNNITMLLRPQVVV